MTRYIVATVLLLAWVWVAYACGLYLAHLLTAPWTVAP